MMITRLGAAHGWTLWKIEVGVFNGLHEDSFEHRPKSGDIIVPRDGEPPVIITAILGTGAVETRALDAD